jgi:uncharacterized LabA/DUF88 family protein
MSVARRMMIFVDGENLVFRYQAMLAKGMKPRSEVVHVPDVLVWHPRMVFQAGIYGLCWVLRANYYTYSVGDDAHVMSVRDQIKALSYDARPFHNDLYSGSLPNHLSPVVFRKLKRSAKAKGVDIQMTVDILTHCHNDSIDAVYLLSGDGDYIPVLQEVLRTGKQVYVSAFSDGLNPDLPHLADSFASLDSIVFGS